MRQVEKQGAIHFFGRAPSTIGAAIFRPLSSFFQDQTGGQRFAEDGIPFFLSSR